MLRQLSIQNFAIIDHLVIDFNQGFSVITGETGAGKSILLGALSLILGQRAENTSLRDPSGKTIIEGIFDISDYGLKDFFTDHDLDHEPRTILRREITLTGTSRTFINDTPVTLNTLRELGDQLVNIHSQHKTTALHDADFQLAILDSFAGHKAAFSEYQQFFHRYLQLKKRLDELTNLEASGKTEYDFWLFSLSELQQARLDATEQAGLEHELKTLEHAEDIKSSLLKATVILSAGEQNIIQHLSDLRQTIRQVKEFHPDLPGLADRIEADYIDLKDIDRELVAVGDAVAIDPARLIAITERLDLIYRLERKHGVSTGQQLLEIQHLLQQKVSGFSSLNDQIDEVKKETEKTRTKIESLAGKLTSGRTKASQTLKRELLDILSKIGLKDASVDIEITRKGDFAKDGLDRVRFLFSANKGGTPVDVAKVASGGELSRLMLSIKSLISSKNLLPTIIFDEIDIGISGEIAGKVGEILRKMSQTMQVISITHLPQIAGKADHHYLASKKTKGMSTTSSIRFLNDEERVKEIARMLSNEKITQAAEQTARELLND